VVKTDILFLPLYTLGTEMWCHKTKLIPNSRTEEMYQEV